MDNELWLAPAIATAIFLPGTGPTAIFGARAATDALRRI